MFNRPQLKSDSKGLIRSGGGKLLRTVIIFILIVFVINLLMMRLEGYHKVEKVYRDYMTQIAQLDPASPEMEQLVKDMSSTITSVLNPSIGARIIILLLGLMSAMIGLGYKWWSLKVTRGHIGDFQSLFDPFLTIGKTLLLVIVRMLLAAAGLIFFIVPGIIILIIYSQAEYIMLENPDITVVECMRKSREMMSGHWGEYFMLELSFIGWTLLAGFIGSIVATFVFAAGGSMMITTLVITCAFFVWLAPYMSLTFAGYYNYISGYTPEEPIQEVAE